MEVDLQQLGFHFLQQMVGFVINTYILAPIVKVA